MMVAQSTFALTVGQIAGSYRVTSAENGISMVMTIKPQGDVDSQIGNLKVQTSGSGGAVCGGLTQWSNTKKTILEAIVLCDSAESRSYKIDFGSVSEFNNFYADVTISRPEQQRLKAKMNFVRLLGSLHR